jgi:hypothetical protein
MFEEFDIEAPVEVVLVVVVVLRGRASSHRREREPCIAVGGRESKRTRERRPN